MITRLLPNPFCTVSREDGQQIAFVECRFMGIIWPDGHRHAFASPDQFDFSWEVHCTELQARGLRGEALEAFWKTLDANKKQADASGGGT